MAPARRVQIAAMWCLGPEWSDERGLAEVWRVAQPFPHLVFDELVAEAALPGLLAVLEDEQLPAHTVPVLSRAEILRILEPA